MQGFLKRSAVFLSLAGGIYVCYIISAIYHQKLLKQPYYHKSTEDQKYFTGSLLFTLMPPFFATIIGQVILAVQGETIKLPWKRCVPISLIINFNMFTYNEAVIYASFPAVVMAKSCSLLSVIIVGVFFSKVKDTALKLTHQKLIIGLLATAGIILFNFFKKQQINESDHPISLLSLGNLFLIISLIGDGFLPDFQAQLKSDYKPSTIQMYCIINRYTFLISLILAFVSGQIFNIMDFMLNYDQFFGDILKLSLLNAVGQLFIYKLIKQFKQHIPAFVIAFRKCLTVIVNILWFGHEINLQQIFGIICVFAAVLWEVYGNYQESLSAKQVQFQQLKQNQPQSVDIMQMIDQQLKNNNTEKQSNAQLDYNDNSQTQRKFSNQNMDLLDSAGTQKQINAQQTHH